MEIQMQYAVANQKLKFDEAWAVRNAEEEMRIRDLYGDIHENAATKQFAKHYRDDSAANPALSHNLNDTELSPDNSARAMDPSTGHAPIQSATEESSQDINGLQENEGVLEDESGEEPSYIGSDSFAQSLAEAS